MAYSAEGYSDGVAELRKSNVANHQELLDFLKPLKFKFAQFAGAAPLMPNSGVPQEPLQMSRRIFLPAAELLDRDKLASLAQLYYHDQQIGDSFLAILEDRPHGDKMSNVFARNVLLVATGAPESEQLLDEFFEICPKPNIAEYAFLADVTVFEEEQIRAYFIGRREGLHSLAVGS